MSVLFSMLFATAAATVAAMIVRELRQLGAKVRWLAAEMNECPEMREVRCTIRTIDVVPLGGTVVRGQFNAVRRRPAPQDALPAAA